MTTGGGDTTGKESVDEVPDEREAQSASSVKLFIALLSREEVKLRTMMSTEKKRRYGRLIPSPRSNRCDIRSIDCCVFWPLSNFFSTNKGGKTFDQSDEVHNMNFFCFLIFFVGLFFSATFQK